MEAFNAFYYSFSPQVAYFIAAHGALRTVMMGILYPLIGILYVSSRIFQAFSFNEELAVTITGIFAALGIGVVYFGPMVILGSRLLEADARSRRSNVRWLILGTCATSILALTLAEASASAVFLTASAVVTVLSFLCLGTFSTYAFARRWLSSATSHANLAEEKRISA